MNRKRPTSTVGLSFGKMPTLTYLKQTVLDAKEREKQFKLQQQVTRKHNARRV